MRNNKLRIALLVLLVFLVIGVGVVIYLNSFSPSKKELDILNDEQIYQGYSDTPVYTGIITEATADSLILDTNSSALVFGVGPSVSIFNITPATKDEVVKTGNKIAIRYTEDNSHNLAVSITNIIIPDEVTSQYQIGPVRGVDPHGDLKKDIILVNGEIQESNKDTIGEVTGYNNFQVTIKPVSSELEITVDMVNSNFLQAVVTEPSLISQQTHAKIWATKNPQTLESLFIALYP